jgi:hypothetical protein
MHKLRKRLAGAATVGIAAAAVTMTLGSGIASADPSPGYPHFDNGNVEAIRSSGSDTTIFMMQRIADLYTAAGLYGCTLNTAAGQTLFDGGTSTATNEEYFCQSGQDVATTDDVDNWSRTEVSTGVDDVGSGAGQNQLCAALSSPLPVDFARSSKPSAAISGCAEQELGYAKDGVPAVDFPTVNPSTWGAPTTSVYTSVNGGTIGPVANGWLPGDPTAGPYDGTAFTGLSNADNGGGTSSTAYRIWCASGSGRISDWGQLTNLGPKLEVVDVTETGGTTVTIAGGAPEGTIFPTLANGTAVSGTGITAGTTVSGGGGTATLTLSKATGTNSAATLIFTTSSTLTLGSGLAIGLPIRVVGVNTASGTEATFELYSEAGTSGSPCASNVNPNAANDPNPATDPGLTGAAHVALENNVAQIVQYAVSDFPNDPADQAIELATSLYFESNGVYNTTPYAAAGTITNGTTKTSYTADKLSMNGETPTVPNLLNNIYPTARTLFNIVSGNTVRASTAGFLNWICDANDDFTKGIDNSTGINFDTELQTLITGTFGFARLSDASVSPSNGGTPADNQPAPNTTCASGTVADGSLTEGNGQPAITTVAFPNT